MAEVDPEDRRTAVVSHLRGAQDRAVAADHDHELTLGARVGQSRRHSSAGTGRGRVVDQLDGGVVGEPEGLCLLLEEADPDAVTGQGVDHLAGDVTCLGPTRVGQHQDAPDVHSSTLSPATPGGPADTTASIAARSTSGTP